MMKVVKVVFGVRKIGKDSGLVGRRRDGLGVGNVGILGDEGRRYGRSTMAECRGEGEIRNGGKREKRKFGERWRGILVGMRRGNQQGGGRRS